MSDKYVIILRAVTMEQEGMPSIAKTCGTLEEATKWVAAQENEYFKPGDYYIVEPPPIRGRL
jgi:hypothetical protein